MNTELLRVQTADGILLEGRLDSPQLVCSPSPCGSADATSFPAVDAWVLVHGTGSNFYSPGVLANSAECTVQNGQAALRVNTRGHDILCTNVAESLRDSVGGAAVESIADCVHDLRAWIDELVCRGFQRIGLVGHSMGGVKVVYSQARDPHPNVAAVVGISPPRFCHAEWQASDKAQRFRDHFCHATELVLAGRGDEFIRVEQPLPLWLTAAGYLAKYGPHDGYDFIRLLPRLTVPTLIIVGTESIASSPAFASVPEAVTKLQQTQSNLHLRIVPGANTGYSGHRDVPVRLALDWVRSSTPTPTPTPTRID